MLASPAARRSFRKALRLAVRKSIPVSAAREIVKQRNEKSRVKLSPVFVQSKSGKVHYADCRFAKGGTAIKAASNATGFNWCKTCRPDVR